MNPRFLRELRKRFVVSRRALDVPDAGLRVDVPVAANPRFVVAAVLFGAPWLLATIVFTGVFFVAAPIDPLLIRFLAWLVAMLLLVFIHVLAAMTVWGAFYQASGSETLVIDEAHIHVLRTAAGITLPARIGRAAPARADILRQSGRRSPQPKIEIKTARGAVRFGSGVSRLEAEAIALRVNAYLAGEEV